jgi:hypothetical protein
MRGLLHPATLFTAVLIAQSALSGCSCRRCERERDQVRLERGEPIESELHRDGSFFTETWYYWADHETVVFFWDERECGCEMSRYTLEAPASRAGADVPVELERSFSTHSSNPYRP